MRKFAILAWLAFVLAGCASAPTQNGDPVPDDGGRPATFDENPGEDEIFNGGKGRTTIKEENQTELDRARWDWYVDVLKFRGLRMPRLLDSLDSKSPEEWQIVRKKVVPAPTPPEPGTWWPPVLVDANDKRIPLTAQQQTYRDYVMWPKAIRTRLSANDWDSAANRAWLVRQGRLYAVLYEFDTRELLTKRDIESERWLQFADSMLAHGKDGQDMLISNMIVRLGHNEQTVVQNAQMVLRRVGPDVIQPLLDVLWVSLAGNPDFNRNVVNTLVDFKERVVGPAITELLESPRGGVTWRSRRYFVDLLGQLHDARGVRAITEEIEKTDITEYLKDESGKTVLRGGKPVPDPNSTEYAVFVFHEYCIEALGALGQTDGLAPIVKLWEKDEDHADGAIAAIYEISHQRVTRLSEAKALAERSRK